MKRLLLTFSTLACFAIISSSTASAQQAPFRFGFKAGANLSSLEISAADLPGQSIKVGPYAGATITYITPDGFFLQSAPGISNKGTKIKGKAPIGLGEGVLRPDIDPTLTSQQWYLHLPIHAGYDFQVLPKASLMLSAGPYLAWGFAGKTRLHGMISNFDSHSEETMEENTFGGRGLKKLDVGVGAAVGLNLGEVILGFSYEHGLRDIRPTERTYIPFYHSSGYKNRSFQFSADFRL